MEKEFRGKTLIVFSIFFIFLVSCSVNFTKTVVQDGEKTHYCKMYNNEKTDLKMADCEFNTKYGLLEGKVILQDNNLYLYNEKQNQAVLFSEMKPIYGFEFPEFKTNETSIEYGDVKKTGFEFPKNVQIIKEEDMEISVN